MTPENCKALLEAGILQAYAEGKEIQKKRYDMFDAWFTPDLPLLFTDKPSLYRIKPEPKPHTFETAIKAIAEHDTTILKDQNNKYYDIMNIHIKYITLHNEINYSYKCLTDWTFPDGTPFNQGDS
jgi:hypothetical protein